MNGRRVTRRQFVRDSAALAAGAAVGLGAAGKAARADAARPLDQIRKTRSYNPNMEYRRLGGTGLWVSAVCLGGHWKRVAQVIGHKVGPYAAPPAGPAGDALRKNRHDVLTRCMEVGINYVDACTEGEVAVYGPALKGRREAMYLGFAMWPRCPRNKKYCNAAELLRTLEQGMKLAQVDYVDVWRLVASTPGKHSTADEQEFVKAFETARKQGKARFTGVSSHGRPWLKRLAETYPQQFQVLRFPYTGDSKELPKESLFDAVRSNDIGTFGIKPFGGGSLLTGVEDAQEVARRARLAVRYVLGNPAITAPIPGLASVQEVDNMALAVKERRELDRSEKAELRQAGRQMWANLPAEYEWLRDWQYV